MMGKFYTALAIVVLLSGTGMSAFAQRAESGGTGEAAWQILRRPMELPDLPAYTGVQTEFADGLMYPNKPGGAAIALHYRAKEAPDVVIGWYADALKNYKWNVQANKDPNILSGTNGKNGVTVNVAPSKKKGFRTEIRIKYKMANK